MDIRLAIPSDAGAIAAIYRPIVEETFISFEETAPSADEMAARIDAHAGRYPWLVAAEGARILGYAYAGAHRSRAAYRWSTDCSVYVAQDARGQGTGRALYTELFRLLRLQRYHSVFAGIALPNDASIALHRAMGFAHVGIYREVGFKLGAWHDTSWWQLLLDSAETPPVEPVLLSEIAALSS